VNTFGRDQILEFLAEIDALLDEPAAVEIIGGAAALLAYGAQTATKDIDTFGPVDARISYAANRAARKILRIPARSGRGFRRDLGRDSGMMRAHIPKASGH
jgi:hypothetical protein